MAGVHIQNPGVLKGIRLFHQLEAQLYSRHFEILGEKVAINLLYMLPNCSAWQRIFDATIVQGYTWVTPRTK
jgi:hypothetical protein